MALNGRVSVDVVFQDTVGTASLKVVSLQESDEYKTGKVAIVTGTCGTAGASIYWQPMSPEYKDASGSNVSFTAVSRVMFQCSRACTATDPDGQANCVRSSGNVSVSDWQPEGYNIDINPQFTSGTASYTLVLYGL